MTRGVSFGPSVGLAPGHTERVEVAAALNMFSEEPLHGFNGEQFGTVRPRALVGGDGLGWRLGQLSIGPDFEVGYAFNHSSVTGDAGAFEESGPLRNPRGQFMAPASRAQGRVLITPQTDVQNLGGLYAHAAVDYRDHADRKR